jgi:predicted metal-binding protein
MPKDQRGPARRISLSASDAQRREDLERFRLRAQEWGASKAEIIPADWVHIDERVRLKCAIPLCPNYNRSLFCPPHSPSPDLVRSALSRYTRAILFRLDVIPAEQFSDRSIQREAVKGWSKKVFEIVGRLETLAFGHGYYLAMGFAQASCRKALCGLDKCLALEGGLCAYPLKARPSMEAVGMDVYGLAARVGWEIYPIYRSVDPAEVPRALAVGIVFVY